MSVERQQSSLSRFPFVSRQASDSVQAAEPAAPPPLAPEDKRRLPMLVPVARTSPVPAEPAEDRPNEAKTEPPAEPVKPARSRGIRKLAIVGAMLLLAGGAATYGYRWWTTGRFVVSTDDAYVRAHNTTLATKVSGYVSNMLVEDNTYVRAGDVIARIDAGDFQLAVNSAHNKVATQQATVERMGRQVIAQKAAVEQAKAQLVSVQAAATRAQLELGRQQSLAQREFASRQTLEQAQMNRDQAEASIRSAQSGIDAAQANVEVLEAQQQEALRGLDELRTALAKAERDLSFTEIRAPVDGMIGNRSVQTGDYVQPGQRLASLIPLDEVYVDANFKETQLTRLRPGQSVAISVDAIPDHAIEGKVTSLSPASGSIFSLLPPDNATGNFTKIVQRVPVRIAIPADIAEQHLLRPGMSVVVGVNTKSPSVADGSAPALASSAPTTQTN